MSKAGKVQDTTRAQGTRFEAEPQDNLYATAYGSGGLSVAHAADLPIDKNNTKMKEGKALSSSFTFMPPAIDKERGGF